MRCLRRSHAERLAAQHAARSWQLEEWEGKGVAEGVMLEVAVRKKQSLEEEVGCAERAARHHRVAQLLGHLHSTLTCVRAVMNALASMERGITVHRAVQTPGMSE
jgi:hypothetical protein